MKIAFSMIVGVAVVLIATIQLLPPSWTIGILCFSAVVILAIVASGLVQRREEAERKKADLKRDERMGEIAEHLSAIRRTSGSKEVGQNQEENLRTRAVTLARDIYRFLKRVGPKPMVNADSSMTEDDILNAHLDPQVQTADGIRTIAEKRLVLAMRLEIREMSA
jgi:hypothetical protein